MVTNIYKGKYVSADDATNLLDIATIKEGCKTIKEASEQLKKITKKITQLEEICNKETLSFDGLSMEETVEAYKVEILFFSNYLKDLAETIETTAQKVLNKQQGIYNERAKNAESKEQKKRDNIKQDEE